MESLLFKGCCEEYSPTEITMTIRSYYKQLLQFLVERPLYFEWEQYIFVHAGVDLNKKDWKKTNPPNFIWIKEPFHQRKIIREKQLSLGIQSLLYYMAICRRLLCGFPITKLVLMVKQYLAA